ncbi:MAG: hypothetical protein WCS17_09715, partial [Prevotella sp.]
MNDVVLDAKMSNEELLNSIDNALGANGAEKKFNDFVTAMNTKLGTIGSGIGNTMSANFNSQLDAMIAKTKELNAQLSTVGTSKTASVSNTSVSSTPATPIINVNDYNSSITNGFKQQDSELVKLNEHYRELEKSSRLAFAAQSSGLKMDLSSAMKMPTNNLDEANEKLERLRA